jgi:hypothetical protein
MHCYFTMNAILGSFFYIHINYSTIFKIYRLYVAKFTPFATHLLAKYMT